MDVDFGFRYIAGARFWRREFIPAWGASVIPNPIQDPQHDGYSGERFCDSFPSSSMGTHICHQRRPACGNLREGGESSLLVVPAVICSQKAVDPMEHAPGLPDQQVDPSGHISELFFHLAHLVMDFSRWYRGGITAGLLFSCESRSVGLQSHDCRMNLRVAKIFGIKVEEGRCWIIEL